MNHLSVLTTCILVGAAWAQIIGQSTDEKKAKDLVVGWNKKCCELDRDSRYKDWAMTTSPQADQKKLQDESDALSKAADTYYAGTYNDLKQFNWEAFQDPILKRLYFLWSDYDTLLLPPEKKAAIDKIQTDVPNMVDGAKVSEFNNPNNKLASADIDEKVKANYKNPEELKYYWQEWHNIAGRPVKKQFEDWLPLIKEQVDTNGYNGNIIKYWEDEYEAKDYLDTMPKLYNQILPLYQELHAYVRFRLWKEYGSKNEIVNPRGPIPASLLGANWGVDAYTILVHYWPYPNKPVLDVTPLQKSKGLKGKPLVQTVDKYYQDLGFPPLPDDLYNKSVLEKFGDINCEEDAYDFCGTKDFRLKLCSEANDQGYFQAAFLTSSIEYFIAFQYQPYMFKQLPGAHFGNAFINMCIKFLYNPNYLKKLGLYDQNLQIDKELQINILFKEAMEWVWVLPFALAYDMWRWNIFQGKIKTDNLNCGYWELRTQLQGVEPPVDRNNNDFDPGVKDWAVSGNQYMLHYMARFMEYDMIRAICRDIGYYDPQNKPDNRLVGCDISGNKQAGEKIRNAMQLGKSKAWKDIMATITGHDYLDPTGLLEFFQPLQTWLHDENVKNKVELGWPDVHPKCH